MTNENPADGAEARRDGEGEAPEAATGIANQQTARRAAADYRVMMKWKPFPLPPLTKRARKGWPEQAERPMAQLQDEFVPGCNLGIALGETSGGLSDVDCDWPEAAALAPHLFPDFPRFGREGRPPGHYLATCPDAGRIEKFCLKKEAAAALGLSGDDRAMVAELRGSGHYTVFPPSVHDDGQKVVWAEDGTRALPIRRWAELAREVGRMAALAVVLRAYPRVSGSRDDVCMALTGALIDAGIADDDVDRLVRLVAKLADDEEHARRGGKASATRAKKEAGEPCTGLPKLCEMLGIAGAEATLRRWLHGEDAAKPDAVPEGGILMVGGRLNGILDRAEETLLERGTPIYQRGPELVRPARLDRSEVDGGVRRDAGSVVLLPIRPHWLVQAMAEAAPWYAMSLKGPVPADPHLNYAQHLMARAGSWRFPVLRGVVTAPTLRADGSILQTPGYDAASQLIYDPAGADFPPVPESPTHEEAAAALRMLGEPFAEFPYVSEEARSVVYAAVLTGLVRRTMRSAPLFAIDAPTPGTGKSLIAEAASIIITGHRAAMFNMGKNEEEFAKQLSVVLRAGDALVVFDNQTRPIEGDFLCSALSQEMVQARILGKSERMVLPSNTLIVATGNNIQLAGDVSRRAVVCRIDAKVERPDQRQFSFDPLDLARRNRAALVVAGLTVLRGYIAAGRPCPLPKMGSFEDFNLVREALVWLGCADPEKTRASVFESDPVRDTIAELLREWREAVGTEPVTMNSLHQRWLSDQAKYAPLIALLNDLTNRPLFNARSAGRKLLTIKDRVVGGLVLRKGDDARGGAYWRVADARSEKAAGAGQAGLLPGGGGGVA
ncbi:MAG: hypothetical protein DYG93_13125 [Leptolyngbya sp. PLA2]|nr:hypothetical protein [Leptolyngbya sp.]MCE7972589.1 hypothetical protein [Leptolyngbya sp. PL-A2]MCQ3939570.1 hypothetical protein [cyanobacterium CYA1]MDL1903826.1 bifunctional DNA primase/polymerase [Synechococcales cyanobacterium CNB]